MGGKGGLIELLLMLVAVLGWGFVELRATRMDRNKAEKDKAEK